MTHPYPVGRPEYEAQQEIHLIMLENGTVKKILFSNLWVLCVSKLMKEKEENWKEA